MHISTAGSLVLRRMDRRGHKRGLVRAKKHGTKSGSGAPLRRVFPRRNLNPRRVALN